MPDLHLRQSSKARLPDRCCSCGQFVGFYPVGFYDDRYCAACYDARHPEYGDYGAINPGWEVLDASLF